MSDASTAPARGGDGSDTRSWARLARVARLPLRTWQVVVLCIGFSVLGGLLALAWATSDLENWGLWARDFFRSPGAAAIAALVAALIAYTSISRQVAVARASLQQQENSSRDESWWQRFEWASNRAIPADEHGVPLPDAVTVGTLQRLSETALSDVQKTACAAMITELTARIAAASSSKDVAEAEPDDSAAVAALSSYVAATRGTSAASSMAEDLVYERNIAEALRQINEPDIQFRRDESSANDLGADFAVEVGGRTVLVVVKTGRDGRAVWRSGLAYVERLRDKALIAEPVVLVTPHVPYADTSDVIPLRAYLVGWNSPRDTAGLINGLRRAAEL